MGAGGDLLAVLPAVPPRLPAAPYSACLPFPSPRLPLLPAEHEGLDTKGVNSKLGELFKALSQEGRAPYKVRGRRDGQGCWRTGLAGGRALRCQLCRPDAAQMQQLMHAPHPSTPKQAQAAADKARYEAELEAAGRPALKEKKGKKGKHTKVGC